MSEIIETINLSEESRRRYLNYALSVITSRALPDARDGLKPVQRRILYTMKLEGYRAEGRTRKCAKISGAVTGSFHPHGTQAVYDALVRLAQDFSYRYPLVHGEGNFGSVDGDPPAAEAIHRMQTDAVVRRTDGRANSKHRRYAANLRWREC